MRKIFFTVFSFLFFIAPCISIEIQGGVSYTVDSARDYLQDGQPDNIQISGPYTLQANNVEKLVYSYNNQKQIVGITVQYKGEENKAYIYNAAQKLIYIDKYDKPINVYPHRGYRYNLEGKLVLTSLSVSKNELFRFDPKGNLLAHSINGIIYDENGEVIGSGK